MPELRCRAAEKPKHCLERVGDNRNGSAGHESEKGILDMWGGLTGLGIAATGIANRKLHPDEGPGIFGTIVAVIVLVVVFGGLGYVAWCMATH